MSKKILDTNFILRYLLEDVPDMFEIACNNIKQEDCTVYPEVIAEVVYVLKSVYKVERKEISNAIISFLDEVECENSYPFARLLAEEKKQGDGVNYHTLKHTRQPL